MGFIRFFSLYLFIKSQNEKKIAENLNSPISVFKPLLKILSIDSLWRFVLPVGSTILCFVGFVVY